MKESNLKNHVLLTSNPHFAVGEEGWGGGAHDGHSGIDEDVWATRTGSYSRFLSLVGVKIET